MYEIWSLGHKPFEGYTNNQVKNNTAPMKYKVYTIHCTAGTEFGN